MACGQFKLSRYLQLALRAAQVLWLANVYWAYCNGNQPFDVHCNKTNSVARGLR